MLKYGQEHL